MNKQTATLYAVVNIATRTIRSWHRSEAAASKAYAAQPFGVTVVACDRDDIRANYIPNNENTRYVER